MDLETSRQVLWSGKKRLWFPLFLSHGCKVAFAYQPALTAGFIFAAGILVAFGIGFVTGSGSLSGSDLLFFLTGL